MRGALAGGRARRHPVRAASAPGSTNDEIALADAILTFPVNPAFASLNLAQAVLLVGYEWRRLADGRRVPFARCAVAARDARDAWSSFFDYLEGELDGRGFFPPDKRPIMARNMRDIFHRLRDDRAGRPHVARRAARARGGAPVEKAAKSWRG